MFGNFDLHQLRESIAGSIYHLYDLDKQYSLPILVQMIVSGKCTSMSRQLNQVWHQKGLWLKDLLRLREFTGSELARLGFHIHKIFLTLKDVSVLQTETRDQLRDLAHLEIDTTSALTGLDQIYTQLLGGAEENWPKLSDESSRSGEMLSRLREQCNATKHRLVIWQYVNTTRFSNQDQAKGDDTFFDFQLEYSHEFFDENWTNTDAFLAKGEHALVTNADKVTHVLITPQVGKSGPHVHYHLLKPISSSKPRKLSDRNRQLISYTADYYLEHENNFAERCFDWTPEVSENEHSPLVPGILPQNSGSLELTTVPMSKETSLSRQTMVTRMTRMQGSDNWMYCTCFSFFCCPCIWCGSCNNACCCRGGSLVSLDYIVKGMKPQQRIPHVQTGDAFLITQYDNQYLALAQTGHFAHCGLIYRYSKNHISHLPLKFQLQLLFWEAKGHISEGSVLVFEITNHEREWDKHCRGEFPDFWDPSETDFPLPESHPIHKNHGCRLTTLDWYFAHEGTNGPYGNHTLIGIRTIEKNRDKSFYREFFKLMGESVDKPYCAGIKHYCKLGCTAGCCRMIDDHSMLFCSELVGILYQRIGLMEHIEPSNVQPSDFGHRKGCWPCCFLFCLCAAYVCDDRALKHRTNARNKILRQPLYILDNSSVVAYKDAKVQACRLSGSISREQSVIVDVDHLLDLSIDLNYVSQSRRRNSLSNLLELETTRSRRNTFDNAELPSSKDFLTLNETRSRQNRSETPSNLHAAEYFPSDDECPKIELTSHNTSRESIDFPVTPEPNSGGSPV